VGAEASQGKVLVELVRWYRLAVRSDGLEGKGWCAMGFVFGSTSTEATRWPPNMC